MADPTAPPPCPTAPTFHTRSEGLYAGSDAHGCLPSRKAGGTYGCIPNCVQLPCADKQIKPGRQAAWVSN